MSDEFENPPAVTPSSGNVFADIGVPAPDVALAKANLALSIARIIADRGWTQEQAAAHLGTDQPKVSALLNGKLAGLSFERLMRWLNRLDYDVNVTIVPSGKSPAQTSVMVVNSGILP